MVILDLTEFTGERPKIWPVDMPDKIRLIEGKHDYGYDVHPMVRRTMWYKKLVKMALEEDKRANIPVGISEWMLRDGAKIINTERGKTIARKERHEIQKTDTAHHYNHAIGK